MTRYGITLLLWMLSFGHAAVAQSSILDKKISLKLSNVAVKDVLHALEDQSGCTFVYSSSLLDTEKIVNADYRNISLGEAIQQLLGSSARSVQVEGLRIHIRPVKGEGRGNIQGKVKTADNLPVEFANVIIKGRGLGTQTDENGSFYLTDVPVGTNHIIVSGVGYDSETFTINVQEQMTATANVIIKISENALSEVVVTGQKRKIASVTQTEVALLDLPLSVQIVDQTILQQQQVIDVRDAIKAVSGVVNTGSYAGGYADFNARGFAMNGSSNFRRDGMMLNNITHLYNDNIERIEVLKGPASVMYGDIAPGAVMNFVTKKPLEYDYKRFEMKIGKYGLLRPSFDLSGPLNKQKNLLYRVNSSYESSKDYVDFVQNKTVMFTPSVTWKIIPQLEWNVEAVIKSDNRTHNVGLISPDGTFEGLKKLPYNRFLGEPSNQFTYRESSVYSTLTYRIGDRWQVKNTSYYTDYQNVVEGMYFPSYMPDSLGNINRSSWMTNWYSKDWGSNLFAVGQVKTGFVKHNLVIGADYMMNRQLPNSVQSQPDLPINIYNPVYRAKPIYKNNTYRGMPGADTFIDRLGFYAQDQVSFLNEAFNIMIGFRYNITARGVKYNQDFPAPEGYEDDRKNVISPRFGLLVKPLTWLSIYGSYSQSYEQNGRDWMTGNVIDATDASQIEAGAKASLLDDRLGLSLSTFKINKENVFGYVYGLKSTPSFKYLNFNETTGIASYIGAHHQSKGVEFDLNGKVTNELNVNFAASFIDATIVTDPAFGSGNRLGGTPRIIANIWANYAFSGKILNGLELGYGFFYKGEHYNTSNNLSTELVSPFWTMDVSVGYKYKNFFTRLNVSNLTDNRGYLGSVLYRTQWVRRSVLSLGVRF